MQAGFARRRETGCILRQCKASTLRSMLLSGLLLDNIHLTGRYCIQRSVGKYNRRNFHEYHACQCLVVRLWSRRTSSYLMFRNSASVFLAIQHASAAMKVTNPSKGKELSSGSIIVTASGKLFICLDRPRSAHRCFSVAGLRSGAGTVDCK